MLSGIAGYLFGSAAEDDLLGDVDDVKLSTFPMENEWLLVARAEMVPVPAEHCPLICHLDESTMPTVETSHRSPVRDVVSADRPHPSPTRAMASRRVTTASGTSSIASATTTFRHHQQQQLASRHASSAATTRKSLQRGNRVAENMSHGRRPRRYNYKLCYSDRQRRAF